MRRTVRGELDTLARIQALQADPVWTDPPVHAGGLPVLLIGGLGATPLGLSPIAEWLGRIGCRVLIAPTRFGIDCGERSTELVSQALRLHVTATGRPALVIAHSRGGQFARAATVREPDLVHALITLGSPLNRLLAIHPRLRARCVMLGIAGTVGVPGLMRTGCLWGGCCRQLRADLTGPFPTHVPFVSVLSREDERVDWRASLDPAARHREVATTHSGLITSPAGLRALAEEIGRLTAADQHAPLAAVA